MDVPAVVTEVEARVVVAGGSVTEEEVVAVLLVVDAAELQSVIPTERVARLPPTMTWSACSASS